MMLIDILKIFYINLKPILDMLTRIITIENIEKSYIIIYDNLKSFYINILSNYIPDSIKEYL